MPDPLPSRPMPEPAFAPAPRAARPRLPALAAEVSALTAEDRTRRIDRFWREEAAVAPLVETDAPGTALLTFCVRDAGAHAVLMTVNRITQQLDDSRMTRMPDTDLWHLTLRLGSGWQGTCTVLALDAEGLAELEAMPPRWAMRRIREQGAPDPRNPHTIDTHAGPASLAQGPDAPALRWSSDGAEHPRGSTHEHLSPSGRRVWLHQPAGAEMTPRPLLVVLDGEVWHRSGYAASALDALAASGAVHAPVLLMIDQGHEDDRLRELSIDGGMTAEIVDELLPWVRTLTALSEDPADIGVSGESLGGLTALKTVFDHSDLFGFAIAQSASLWQHDMIDRARGCPRPVRLHLTAGTHEAGLVEHNRRLVDVLAGTAHDVSWTEYDGGHDMAWWRPLWAEGVARLLAR